VLTVTPFVDTLLTLTCPSISQIFSGIGVGGPTGVGVNVADVVADGLAEGLILGTIDTIFVGDGVAVTVGLIVGHIVGVTFENVGDGVVVGPGKIAYVFIDTIKAIIIKNIVTRHILLNILSDKVYLDIIA
jgi:hypothetical protein